VEERIKFAINRLAEMQTPSQFDIELARARAALETAAALDRIASALEKRQE
jgi:hypothetical protein